MVCIHTAGPELEPNFQETSNYFEMNLIRTLFALHLSKHRPGPAQSGSNSAQNADKTVKTKGTSVVQDQWYDFTAFRARESAQKSTSLKTPQVP